jgi:uncharacterized membrane protein
MPIHPAAEAAIPHLAAENLIAVAVQWLKLGVETVGAVIIGVGVLVTLLQLVRGALQRDAVSFTAVRLTLARYLALALEFQLGADILSTAVAPSREEIIKLGAIAVIRTGLNYFLSREMQEEKATSERERQVVAPH